MLGQRPGQAWGAIVSAAHSACRERRLRRRARTAPSASSFQSSRVPARRSPSGSPARYFLPRGHLASTARERWQVFRQERSQEPVWPQDPRERFPCAVHNSPAERQPRSRGRELPARISDTRCSLSSRDVTTPKFPPPPFSAHKSSEDFSSLTVFRVPSARTSSAESRLSTPSPRLGVNGP